MVSPHDWTQIGSANWKVDEEKEENGLKCSNAWLRAKRIIARRAPGGHRFEFPASVCSTPDKKDNKVKEWEAKSNKATRAMAAGVES